MLSVIIGLVFMVLSLWGIIGWWPDFVNVIKGVFPLLFLFGGALAVIAGVTSIRDSMTMQKAMDKEADQGQEKQ